MPKQGEKFHGCDFNLLENYAKILKNDNPNIYGNLMLYPNKLQILAVMWILFTLSPQLKGDDKSAKKEQPKNYAEVVSQLVSPNKKPETSNSGGDATVKFPEGYDVKAQERVNEARRILQENIKDAFPELIKGLEDGRYCMTISWAEGDAYYNESVSGICSDIIKSHLEVYRDKISFSGPTHWNSYNFPVSKEWLEARKDRSIAELQIEAIKWAIEQRMKEPKEKIREDRKNEVVKLNKLKESIEKSKKPAKPEKMLRMVTSDK